MSSDNNENMEPAEVSAAKDTVYDVLEAHLRCDEHDLVGMADEVIERLMKCGVLIPEWMPQPFLGGLPAQGYYPTASQMEAWQGRAVTPIRVTGR